MNYISESEINILINNCRIIIRNKNLIYDVTDYLDIHPGGKEALLKSINCNCLRDFNFHSKKSQKMWNDYLIGSTNKIQENLFIKIKNYISTFF